MPLKGLLLWHLLLFARPSGAENCLDGLVWHGVSCCPEMVDGYLIGSVRTYIGNHYNYTRCLQDCQNKNSTGMELYRETRCYCVTNMLGYLYSSSYYNSRTCLIKTPSHREEGTLSLVGGSGPHEGNVHIDGVPVCSRYSWDLLDAWVVCQQAGYLAVTEVTKKSKFGVISSLSWSSPQCTGNEITITDCFWNDPENYNCYEYYGGAGVICSTRDHDVAVTLNGESGLEGTVLLDDKEICSYNWDAKDGSVVCNQLGYPHLIHVKEIKANSSSSIGYHDFRCKGDELSILDCIHLENSQTCPNNKVAQVVCSRNQRDFEISLVGGNSSSEGNVYVDGSPVCDNSWTWEDAQVVCRNLGYNYTLTIVGNSHFGPVPDNFINGIGDIRCAGDEEFLSNCSFSSTVRCSSSDGAGVFCSNSPPDEIVSLRGGSSSNEGILFVDDMPVYYSGFDLKDAWVVCKQLGYPGVEEVKNNHFGSETQWYRMGSLNCIGDETTILDCPHNEYIWRWNSHRTAGVICSTEKQGTNVTIRNSQNTSDSGLVHVDGKPVCDDSWDKNDAQVVCNELGYLSVLYITGSSEGDQVELPYSMTQVECRGEESSLTKCIHRLVNKTSSCGASNAAGVHCLYKEEKGTGDVRVLTSTDYPNNYPNNENTEFKLSVAEGYFIFIMFQVFELESCCDYLQVCDQNMKCGSRLSGSSLPDPIIVPTSNATLVFHSDWSATGKGFRLFYKKTKSDKTRHNKISLIGGNTTQEGNVYLNEAPLCHRHGNWEWEDAEVVCRELGYNYTLKITGDSYFGEVPYWFLYERAYLNCRGTETSAFECPAYSQIKTPCSKNSGVGVVCSSSPPNNTVTLIGGEVANEGNVYVDGMPVCARYWDLQDAWVVCKQLGFASVVDFTRRNRFGDVGNWFRMSYLQCTGEESSLVECPHSKSSTCSWGYEGAGVICSSELRVLNVALVGGSGPNEGDIFVDEKQPICASDFDMDDAVVICRQLNFSYVSYMTGYSRFYNISTESGISLSCEGTEATISECIRKENVNCDSHEAAGLSCSNKTLENTVKLVGGNLGKEGNVYINDVPLCHRYGNWDWNDAEVICKELGYNYTLKLTGDSYFGEVPPWFLYERAYLNCRGTETSIFDCTSYSQYKIPCTKDKGVGVVCSSLPPNNTIALVGGKGSYEGNVLVDGMPVCSRFWDIKDAWVVCKQLGFSSVVDSTTSNKFGNVGNWYGMTYVHCTGEESTLEECPHRKSSTCYGAAGVVCSTDLIGCIDDHFLCGNTSCEHIKTHWECEGNCQEKHEPCDGQCSDGTYFCNNRCYQNEMFLCGKFTCLENSTTNHQLYRSCGEACIKTDIACEGTCPFGLFECNGRCYNEERFPCGASICHRNTSYYQQRYRTCGEECIREYEACKGTCTENYFLCGSNQCKQNTSHNLETYRTCEETCTGSSQPCKGSCIDEYFKCGSNVCKQNTTYNMKEYRTCGESCLQEHQPCDGHCPDNRFLCGNECRRTTQYNQTMWWSCGLQCQRATEPCDGDCPPFMEISPEGVICIHPPEPSCRNVSCGGDDLSPHGTCVAGTCMCSLPWYGDHCENEYIKPMFQSSSLSIISNEGELLEVQAVNITGSFPIHFTLFDYPNGMIIENSKIVWPNPVSGTYNVKLEASNKVGSVIKKVELKIMACYSALLDKPDKTEYFVKSFVWLAGSIQLNDNCSMALTNRPVTIAIKTLHANYKYKISTDSQGKFIYGYLPPSNLIGNANIAAFHPIQKDFENSQVDLMFAGFRVDKRVSIKDEIDDKLSKEYLNIASIYNDGPLPISNITMNYDQNFLHGYLAPEVNVTLMSNISTILDVGQKFSIQMRVSSTSAVYFNLPITVSSKGMSQRINLKYTLEQLRPNLMTAPSSINLKIAKGKSKLWTANIENIGKKIATGIDIQIPDGSFTKLVTLPNKNLAPESSMEVTFSSRIPENQALGEKYGNILITCNESSHSNIYYNIYIMSNDQLNLTIVIEDEYTFFAEGNPLVEDATVTLQSRTLNFNQRTIVKGGKITFSDIFEGLYEIYVDSPDHSSHRDVHLIQNEKENNIIYIFLKKSTVKYTWSVEKVEYKDEYEIEIQVDFVTEVPAPVVTVMPPFIDLDKLISGEIKEVTMNITNHGLIRVDDIDIIIPKIECFMIKSNLDTYPDHLDARSSFVYPLIFERDIGCLQGQQDGIQKRSTKSGASSIACFMYHFTVGMSYLCREPVKNSQSSTVGSRNGPPAGICGGGGGGGISGGGSGGGGGGWGGNAAGGGQVYSSTSKISCRDCINAVLSCAGAGLGLAGLLGGPITWGAVALYSVSNCIPNSRLGVTSVLVGGWSPTCIIPGNAPYSCYQNLKKCFKSSRRKRTPKRSADDIEENAVMYAHSMEAIKLSNDLIIEFHGYNLTYLNETIDMIQFDNQFMTAVDGGGPEGQLITANEAQTIIEMSVVEGKTEGEQIILNIVERWNTTTTNWKSQIKEPVGNQNMMSYAKFKMLSDQLQNKENLAKEEGYENFLEMFRINSAIIETYRNDNEKEDGVCAVVRIKLVQQLAITREAFSAQLDIENSDDEDIMNINVEIVITNNDNEISTSKFSISNATMEGIVDAGTIAASNKGSMKWLIIPYHEAAPEDTTAYYIGGTFTYTIGEDSIEIILTPAKISVVPDPRLSVHYFWEKFVWGDDPFTDDIIEPSIPFVLVASIKNFGFGIANDVSLSSGQPEIIENEKGLLVDFNLIGHEKDGTSVEPKFTASLGNLAPNTTSTVKWWMNCTLVGIFRNFTIDIRNKNPNGDPKLSIIDDFDVHELFHEVKNPKKDTSYYLVRDKKVNGTLLPDTIYETKTLETSNIITVEANLIDLVIQGNLIIIDIGININMSGPIYFKFETSIPRKLFYIHSMKKTVESKNEINIDLPKSNAWFLNYNYKNKFLDGHVFDILDENSNSVSYKIIASTQESLGTSTLTTNPGTISTTMSTSTTILTALSSTLSTISTDSTEAPSPTFKQNWFMTGKKIKTRRPIKSPNHIKCWGKCEANSKCKFIMWKKKKKLCSLFSSYTGGKKKNGYISGPVATTPPAPPTSTPSTDSTPSCIPHPLYQQNWLIIGTKIKSKKSIKTKKVNACWNKCKVKASCNYITWIKKKKVCTLFSTKTGGKKKTGYISGSLSSC